MEYSPDQGGSAGNQGSTRRGKPGHDRRRNQGRPQYGGTTNYWSDPRLSDGRGREYSGRMVGMAGPAVASTIPAVGSFGSLGTPDHRLLRARVASSPAPAERLRPL